MNVGQIVLYVALVASLHGVAQAAASEAAQSDAERKKPLQRCDQLKGQAELDCLNKARERIVEARKKREGSSDDKSKASSTPGKPAAAPQGAR